MTALITMDATRHLLYDAHTLILVGMRPYDGNHPHRILVLGQKGQLFFKHIESNDFYDVFVHYGEPQMQYTLELYWDKAKLEKRWFMLRNTTISVGEYVNPNTTYHTIYGVQPPHHRS